MTPHLSCDSGLLVLVEDVKDFRSLLLLGSLISLLNLDRDLVDFLGSSVAIGCRNVIVGREISRLTNVVERRHGVGVVSAGLVFRLLIGRRVQVVQRLVVLSRGVVADRNSVSIKRTDRWSGSAILAVRWCWCSWFLVSWLTSYVRAQGSIIG